MYDLELSAKGVTVKLNGAFVGKDLLVWLSGGAAHIGAVAVAVPRPSLEDNGNISADASIMTIGGHKEDLLARKIALALASKLNVKVCVTAGMHWDSPTPSQLEAAKELSMRLTKTLLMHIAKDEHARKLKPAAEDTEEAADLATTASETAMPETPAQPVARPAIKPAPRPAPQGKTPVVVKPVTPPEKAAPPKPAGVAQRPAGAVKQNRPAVAGKPVQPQARNNAGAVTTTPSGVIVDDSEGEPTPKATSRPAAPAGRPVQRDAQGRPATVRQAVNATLKKPLLKK